MDLNSLKQANKNRWDNCHIDLENGPVFKKVADVLTANRARYQAVSDTLAKQGHTIPWQVIAVAHYREAGFKNGQPDWDTYLGNGQPLSKKTTIVPKGRGPFKTWEEGAVDALVEAPPKAALNKDWSIGGTLTILEQYNGLGYAQKNLPSPYLWARTDQYVKGKYTSDGKYSPNTVDSQLGCAGILKFLGMFKTAPTGSGTVAGAVVVGGGAAAAASNPTWWSWATDHWMILLLGVVGAGLLIDFALAIYNNEKNQLKVTNVSNIRG